MTRLSSTLHVMTAAVYLPLSIVGLMSTAPLASAQDIEVVRSFNGAAHPDAGLIQGTDGFLYGTTGGNGNDTVFKIRLDGTQFSTIHAFNCATDGCAAADSIGGLIQSSDGFLYGTRSAGGSANNGGTIFKVNPNGSVFNVIHSFQGAPNDGAVPLAGLIQLSDGFLYGTAGGGAFGRGAAFKIFPDGSGFTIIHSFDCTSDLNCSYSPYAGLIRLSDGLLYGTTVGTAGTIAGTIITGTIYRVSPDGATFNIIHSFQGDPSDGGPFASLIQGSDGFLYGTTGNLGAANTGTVFKIQPDGTQFSTIHSFQGAPSDGGLPLARLSQLSDGNFYGTTQRGGTSDCGTVFKISANGVAVFGIINSFAFAGNGCFPGNGLIQAGDSNLYGTTPTGGTGGPSSGTIFRVPFSNPIGQAPAITSANSATFTVGSLWSFTVTTTASPTATLGKTGTLPAGVTFTDNGNGTATLRGTARSGTGGSYPIVLTGSNGVPPNATQNFTLTVNANFTADKGVVLGANVIIGAGSHLNKNAQIGSNVVIGANVQINQNVVIGSGAHIGNNTVIDQSTNVGANAMIGANVRIGQSVRVGANAIIPDGTVVPARTSVP